MDRQVQLLDLDDTLIPDEPATRQAIRVTLEDLDLPADDAGVDIVLGHARRAWQAHPHRRSSGLAEVSSWEALWLTPPGGTLSRPVTASLVGHDEHVWTAVLAELGADPGAAVKTALAYRDQRRALLRPMPGVVDALDTLAGRHRLWLVTNGATAHQRAKLDACGLARYFERVFVSAEVGNAKVKPGFAAAVHAALDADNLQACLVIGDSITNDVSLARHGGWPALHICRTSPCDDANREPDVPHASSLADASTHCRCPADTEGRR
jgi:HAD superfamily hydrolase (TIGR01549 family)